MKILHFFRWDDKEEHLFESTSRSKVIKWLKDQGLWAQYKKHKIRIGHWL